MKILRLRPQKYGEGRRADVLTPAQAFYPHLEKYHNDYHQEDHQHDHNDHQEGHQHDHHQYHLNSYPNHRGDRRQSIQSNQDCCIRKA